MFPYSSIFVTCLLVAFASTVALERRDVDNPSILQGLLGTDGYWNDYDGGTNHYVVYKGDGSKAAGWPGQESWVSFNELWITNSHIIARSCDLLYKQPNLDAEETQDLYDAIKQVAHETRVDHRFIFAAILQETQGCVRAPNDGDDVGVLQSYKGTHTCNAGGKVTTPCPKDTILGMVRDGIAGSSDAQGHGFAEDINEQASFVNNDYNKVGQAYFRAARLFNSGNIDSSNDLEKASSGLKCYSSDIANRLMGWTDAASTCDFDK